MIQKYYKFCALPIFTLLLSILKFVFYIQIPEVTASGIITPLRNTHANESTVIIVRSQQIAAYDETIKGFEEGYKEKNISIKAIYGLKGNIEEGKKVVQKIKENKLKPTLILAVGILATALVKEQFGTVVTKELLDIILKVALKNHLLTFCTSSAIVRSEALISISRDYASTGLQASQIAQKLLNDPRSFA